jgi:hypothetical protein
LPFHSPEKVFVFGKLKRTSSPIKLDRKFRFELIC